MRVTVTGATGLIGTRVVAALQERGDEVTVLSRRPEHAHRLLGVDAVGWNPPAEPAPAEGLAGRAGVIHLAGEPIAQSWTRRASNASVQRRARNGTAGRRAGAGRAAAARAGQRLGALARRPVRIGELRWRAALTKAA